MIKIIYALSFKAKNGKKHFYKRVGKARKKGPAFKNLVLKEANQVTLIYWKGGGGKAESYNVMAIVNNSFQLSTLERAVNIRVLLSIFSPFKVSQILKESSFRGGETPTSLPPDTQYFLE